MTETVLAPAALTAPALGAALPVPEMLTSPGALSLAEEEPGRSTGILLVLPQHPRSLCQECERRNPRLLPSVSADGPVASEVF